MLAQLASLGLRLHGFGLKRRGLKRFSQHVLSADSTAWSIDARYSPPLPGHMHKSCSNCLDYALRWRAATVAELERLHVQRAHQLELF